MNSTIRRIGFGALSCLLLSAQAGLAQNQPSAPFAYPTQNQTPAQQQEDKAACSAWATEQTGVDPSQLPSNTTAQATQPQVTQPQVTQPQVNQSQVTQPQAAPPGTIVRGAGRGAAVGAVSGAIGGDAGQGAAIGSAVGALGGVFSRRDASRTAAQEPVQAPVQEQTPVNAAEQQQLQTYFRAWTACMQGRGYTVN